MSTPFILSLAYRNQIDEVCKLLPQLGLKYFVMYLIFNDYSTFVLSNVYSILKPYYYEELYQEDYTYTPQYIKNSHGYYLCNQTQAISMSLKDLLANQHNVLPIYNVIRQHAECTFVFSAIRDLPIEDENQFYLKTIKKFETFCIGFVDHFLHLIITYNPHYKHALVLTNKQLRDAVIRGEYVKPCSLTLREQECLSLAAQGKSNKQIAQILKISPFTVDSHLKRVREVFQCKTIVEAIVAGIHRGVIGNLNPISNRSTSVSSVIQTIARPIIFSALP